MSRTQIRGADQRHEGEVIFTRRREGAKVLRRASNARATVIDRILLTLTGAAGETSSRLRAFA
jgi:hypothetical protein